MIRKLLWRIAAGFIPRQCVGLHFLPEEQPEATPRTVNGYIAALSSYNKYAIEAELQTNMVVRDKDRIKIQAETVNPNDLEVGDIDLISHELLVRKGKGDTDIDGEKQIK